MIYIAADKGLSQDAVNDTDSIAKVWAISSDRSGEASQICGLADRLGESWERKDLEYKPLAAALGLARRVSCAGTTTELTGPWPRVVISAGLKNEPICRWIRKASGGFTRIVHLGRTWAPTSEFDLVVTTPQYRVPSAPNVVQNPLTVHGITEAKLAAARCQWQQQFASYPRPLVGVLLGGRSGPYEFNDRTAQEISRELNGFNAEAGGTFLITTSARTPAGFVDLLRDHLQGDHYFYEYTRGDPNNPYLGILAVADRLIVTGDSIAMLSEAISTGKPVHIANISTQVPAGLGVSAYRAAMRWGHRRWTRDVELVHRAILGAGLAAELRSGLNSATPIRDLNYLELTRSLIDTFIQ